MHRTFTSRAKITGFSLVEILVGLLIGLIGIIVMMQVFSVSEERKRSTTAGSDAQNAAFIALDGLQRAIMQSGGGFAQTRLLGCDITLPGGATVPLAPVVINPVASDGTPLIPAGDNGTITLLIAYGSGNYQPDGYTLNNGPTTGNVYNVTTSDNFVALSAPNDTLNDWLIHAPDGCPLLLRQVSASANAANNQTNVTVRSAPAAAENATAIFNLGGRPGFLAYAVRGGRLTVCNLMEQDCTNSNVNVLTNTTIWRPLVSDIASFQAQYGHDTTATQDGVPDTFNQATPANSCGWARMPTVRLAIVSRNVQFEKDELYTAAVDRPALETPKWIGGNLDVSENGTRGDWQHYRYRVFETQVPIRNIAWMGAVSGC